MDFSIIIPVYNEKNSLKILNEKIYSSLNNLRKYWEIIYVDDGSTDGSDQELKDIFDKSENVKVISFNRNYGQTQAIAAGFDNADGQKIIIMDADLQNDPADIPHLLKKLEEGYDLVSGWRIRRQDNLLLKKIPSLVVNKLSFWLSKVKIHDLGCTLKAYRREILENIEFYGEIHRFLPICAAMQGAKIVEIPVKHQKRKFGKSKYSIWRGVKAVLDLCPLIFTWRFIAKPIYFFGGIGLFLIGLSAITAFFIIIRKLFWAGVWVSPLLFLFVILLSIGVQLILMGIMMEFIIRLYQGSCGQKRYKIKKILKK